MDITLAVAPGFRFYPTEEEMVSFYLYHKLHRTRPDLIQAIDRLIPILDVFHCNPWDLPNSSGEVCRGDTEQWLFFNPMQENEIHGGRPIRHNTTGYWKSTGSPSYVYSSDNRCIGLKRTMVFYIGRIRNATKTDWKINQYKAIEFEPSPSSSTASIRTIRQELSLCRVYKTLKCRRSFDRRPVGLDAGEPSLVNLQLTPIEEDDELEERTTPQNPLMEAGTITVTDQTSALQSINNGCLPSQTENTNFLDDTTDNEPLWDWEHLYSWDCDIGSGY